MRQVVIARPFAGGYRSDVPDYALNPNECAYAQDLIYPFGIAQQRWGWSYDGSVADVAADLVGVDRSRYPITSQTVTTTSDVAGNIYIHNQSAAGTSIWPNPWWQGNPNPPPNWIPRCMYNGEVIYCAQDGETPLLRYAGSQTPYASLQGLMATGDWNFPAGKSEAVGAGVNPVSFPAGATKGTFFSAHFVTASNTYAAYPGISTLVLSRNSSSSLSLSSVRNATSSTANPVSAGPGNVEISPLGFAWPGVSIWDSGTVSSTGSVIKWSFSGADLAASGVRQAALGYDDSLLVINPTPGGPHFIGSINSVDTISPTQQINTIAQPSFSVTNATYRITRRLPFKDATVHKNSLWGTGVKQYPNRLYVGPPLWDIGLPPGAVEPFDPTVNDQFADLDELLLQPIDVPSRYDTDPVVALLSTPGPLLVLKGSSVYGIYGSYPSYEQTLIANGSGCIDLRSAVTIDGVAFWAGKDGVFMYAGGQIQPLTRGKIEREWQALMRGYVAGTSYVTTAMVAGHLVISVGGLTNTATGEAKIGPDSSNPSERTYIYDMRSQQWTSRISNAKMRNMTSTRVPGEVPSILGVSDDRQGRVIDLTPTITGTKCTNRASQTLAAADPTDAAGTGPRMQAWSSSALAQANGIEGEARLLDLSVHTTLTDTSGLAYATALDVTTAHGDALDSPSTSVVFQGTITGDTVDRVDRTKFRVNKTGRLHQVRVDLDTTPSTTTKTQIPEMVASFRDNRRMT